LTDLGKRLILPFVLNLHKADISLILKELCKRHFLSSTGNGRGTKYHLYASNISNVASNSTKQRLSQDELYNLICNNCKDYTSLEELAQRVNKNSKYLQNHILKDMISNNLIERLYPEIPGHPNQKYRKK